MSLKSKRILILSTSYLPDLGGSELAIKNITDRMPDIAFDLITSRPRKTDPKEEIVGNVNVYRVGGSFGVIKFLVPKFLLPIFITFKAIRLMNKNKYDLIHAYQASQAAGAGWMLKVSGVNIPFVVTIQEGKNLKSQKRIVRIFRRIILEAVNAFTVISVYLKDYLSSFGFKDNVYLIPNGVDTKLFKPLGQEKREELRDRFGISGSEKVVITISRLVEKNGVEDLIKSISYLPKDFKIVIVGDGHLMARLRNLVSDLRSEARVIFTGSIPHENLHEYLNMADVFARPAHSEGLGTVFIEAMASGLPIIGTAVGGIPDILIEGDNGLFCATEDPRDIADKIQRIFSENLKERMGMNGRELAVEKYDWNHISDLMREFYINV